MPKEVSRNKSTKQIRHNIQTGSKKDTSFCKNKDSTNITEAKPKPKLQANFFCMAPIGKADCFLTTSLAKRTVGENLGFINIPMIKLNIKNPAIYGVIIYLLKTKPLTKAIKPRKSMIPALALITLSSSTL